MIKKIKSTKMMVVLLLVMITFSCKPDPLVYAAPADLVGTIYVQLESLGNFKHYLAALDRTEYAEPLKKGGSWTVFAPNDEAFEQFMQEEGYATIADIPSTRILHIVQYTIIKDSWNTTNLTFNVIRTNSGFYEGNALKRYTQYQDSIIEVNATDYPTMPDLNPGSYKLHLAGATANLNKTITYILPSYMESTGIVANDVNYLFEGIDYQQGDDMNIYEANVVKKNVVSENGMVYTMDKVIEPRMNLYQNLTSEEYGGKYTMFKQLLERFGFLRSMGFFENEETGVNEEIFRLGFRTEITQNLLPFDPNNEAYPKLTSNVDQNLTKATGLIVPSNEALMAYINGDSALAKLYDSYDEMSEDVLFNFLTTFFFAEFQNLTPTDDGQHFTVGLDVVDFVSTDAVDKKMLSNGFFIGVDKVYENSSFGTVLGQLLLDPQYSVMNESIARLGIDNALKGLSATYSIFGIKNDQFDDIADPNSATRRVTGTYIEEFSMMQLRVEGDPIADNNRLYPLILTSPTAADLAYVEETIDAIVLSHVINDEVVLNSTNYYRTDSGDYFKVEGNTIAGGEDIRLEQSRNILVDSVRTTSNGKFYVTDGAIKKPSRFTYGALLTDKDFSLFVNALDAAGQTIDIPDVLTDKIISFISFSRTFSLLAPNNEAMQQAIDDGVIVDPNNLPTDELGLAIAKRDLTNFVRLHFIQQSLVTDGVTTGTFNSLYNTTGDDLDLVYLPVEIEGNSTTGLTAKRSVTGNETVSTTTDKNDTNLFSKNVVIHKIDSYLKF